MDPNGNNCCNKRFAGTKGWEDGIGDHKGFQGSATYWKSIQAQDFWSGESKVLTCTCTCMPCYKYMYSICVGVENCYAWGVVWRRYWSWGESDPSSEGLSTEPRGWHRARKNWRTGMIDTVQRTCSLMFSAYHLHNIMRFFYLQLHILTELNKEQLIRDLKPVISKGIKSLAVVLLHSYTWIIIMLLCMHTASV